MNELGYAHRGPVDDGAARPIRRFVLGIALVAMALGGIWWLGVFTPRTSLMVTEGEHDLTSGRGTIHLQVDNDAALPVEIRSASLEGDDSGIISALLDGEPIDTGRTLSGRTSGHLVLEYTTRDCLGSGMTPLLTVVVQLSAPLGASDQEQRVSTPTSATC